MAAGPGGCPRTAPGPATHGWRATAGEPAAVALLTGRVVQVPVPESRYSSLRPVKGGLAWLREPLSGALGEGTAELDGRPPRGRPASRRPACVAAAGLRRGAPPQLAD